MPNKWIAVPADLKDQIIRFWVVIYHHDADCTYTFFDWQHLLSGIGGSLLTYFDDDGPGAVIANGLIDSLKDMEYRPVIPIALSYGGKKFYIDIYRWEIDDHTPLFAVLSKCYTQVDDDTKIALMGLLSNKR